MDSNTQTSDTDTKRIIFNLYNYQKKRETLICISYSVADDFHTIITLSKQLIQDRLKMRTWRINEKLIIINYISIIS